MPWDHADLSEAQFSTAATPSSEWPKYDPVNRACAMLALGVVGIIADRRLGLRRAPPSFATLPLNRYDFTMSAAGV